MTKANYEMNIPELKKLKSIAATPEDLKDEANEIQKKRRKLRTQDEKLLIQLNMVLFQIEKQERENL